MDTGKAKTKNPIISFGKSEEGIITAFIISKRSQIITGDYYGKIRFWNMKTGELEKTISRYNTPIKHIETLLQNKILGIILNGNKMGVYDLTPDGNCDDVEVECDISILQALLNENPYVVSLSFDQGLSVVDIRSNTTVKSIKGPETRVKHFKLSRDYRYVILSCVGGNVYVIDVRTSKYLFNLRLNKTVARLVMFSNSSRYIVFACDNGEVQLWDWRSDAQKVKFKPTDFMISSINIDDSEHYLTTVDQHKGVQLWSLEELHSKVVSNTNTQENRIVRLWEIDKGKDSYKELRKFIIDSIKAALIEKDTVSLKSLISLVMNYNHKNIYFTTYCAELIENGMEKGYLLTDPLRQYVTMTEKVLNERLKGKTMIVGHAEDGELGLKLREGKIKKNKGTINHLMFQLYGLLFAN